MTQCSSSWCRYPGRDLCICEDGLVGCPQGYSYCDCNPQPYGLCVADQYYCTLYCAYLPSMIQAALASGKNICPLDPGAIDFYRSDPIYPGWDFLGKRRLQGLSGGLGGSGGVLDHAGRVASSRRRRAVL